MTGRVSIGGWNEPQDLVRRVLDVCQRIERELPAGDLASDILVLLSDLGREIKTVRAAAADGWRSAEDQLLAEHIAQTIHREHPDVAPTTEDAVAIGREAATLILARRDSYDRGRHDALRTLASAVRKTLDDESLAALVAAFQEGLAHGDR